MSGIDLSLLTPPDVIEPLDYETLLAERKARLVSLYPEAERGSVAATLALESEPIVRILQESAYRELILRARYNDEAKSVMLAYARGADLDHIGVTYYQAPRFVISPADNTTIPPMPAVYESDEDYRARLAESADILSTAGPRDAYIRHAKNASYDVLDAECDSPVPGTTRVPVLSRTGNGTPNAALLNVVLQKLSGETVRPLNEKVEVVPAQIFEYAIRITVYALPGPDASVLIQEARKAVQTYAADRHRLGYDVTHSGIYAAGHRPGAQRVVIQSPAADIVCNRLQAAFCTDIQVTFAGIAQ